MKENLKVAAASVIGFVTPTLHGLFTFAEPLLKMLLLVGQVGVTGVTILYIIAKWRNIRNKKK